jgi:hypothetical protein
MTARRFDDAGPNEPDNAPSTLEETVLGLLEDAGLDVETNDAIIQLVAEGEARLRRRLLLVPGDTTLPDLP